MTPAVRVAAWVVAAAVLGCARQGSPSGGPRDVRGPVVIATEPAPNALVEDLATVIRFRFSERVSERPARGTLNDAVLVSPRGGPVRVDHSQEQLEVRVDGGLLPGLVYRFTLLPVIADLFGNAMTEPFEVVLSTGGPLVEDALAGQVLDRVTGRPVPDAEVELLPPTPVGDTIRYVSRSDAAGLFVFRYVPPGPYNLIAFLDRNRNLAPDPSETFGRRGVLLNEGDTLLADVVILESDTSAAQLVRAEVVDSTTLRLVFSDYLDPESVGVVAVSLGGPEGQPLPEVTGVLHPTTWEAQRDSVRARAGELAAGGGRVPRAGETVAVPGQERGGLPRGVPLPRREVIVMLAAPLTVDVSYALVVTGVVNINRNPFGRGEASVVRPLPPAPPGEAGPTGDPARDSVPLGDSIGPLPDTSQVVLPEQPR